MTAGIDYGLGMSNVDKENGIRYGVIHNREVCQAWADDSEAVYPELDNEADDKCDDCGFKFKQHREFGADDESEVSENACDHFELDTSGIETEASEFIYEQDGYACSQSADDTDIFSQESVLHAMQIL
jgi:hypothetical protein